MEVVPLASENCAGLVSALTPLSAMEAEVPQATPSENVPNTSMDSTATSSERAKPTYQMISMNINGVVQSVLVPLATSTTSLSIIPSVATANPLQSYDDRKAVGESDPAGLKVIRPRIVSMDQTHKKICHSTEASDDPPGVQVFAPKVRSSTHGQTGETNMCSNVSTSSSKTLLPNKQTQVAFTKVDGTSVTNSLTPVFISQPGLPGAGSKLIFLPNSVTKSVSPPKSSSQVTTTTACASPALSFVSFLGGSTSDMQVVCPSTTRSGSQVFIVSGPQAVCKLVSVATDRAPARGTPKVRVKQAQSGKQTVPATVVPFIAQPGMTAVGGTSRTVLNPGNSVMLSKPNHVNANPVAANKAGSTAGMPSVTSLSPLHGASSVVSSTAQNMPTILTSLLSSGVIVSSTISTSTGCKVPAQSPKTPASAQTTSLTSGNQIENMMPSSTVPDGASNNTLSSVTAEDTNASFPNLKIDSVYSLNSSEVAKQNNHEDQGDTKLVKAQKDNDESGKIFGGKSRAEPNKNIKRLQPQRMVTQKESGQCSCCVMHLRPQHLYKRKQGKVLQHNAKEYVDASCTGETKQKYRAGPLCFKRKHSGLDIGEQTKRKCGYDGLANKIDMHASNVHFGGDFLRRVKLCSVKLESLNMRGNKSLSYRHWKRLQKQKQTRLKKQKLTKNESHTVLVKVTETKSSNKNKNISKEPIPKNVMATASTEISPTPLKPEVTVGGSQVLAAVASRVFGTSSGQQGAAIISSPNPLMLGHPVEGARMEAHEGSQALYRYLLIRTNTGNLMVTPLADTPQLGEACAAHASILSAQIRGAASTTGHSVLHQRMTSPTFLSTAHINPLTLSGLQVSQQMPDTGSQNQVPSAGKSTANRTNLFEGVTVKSEPVTSGYGDEALGVSQEPELTMTITKEEREAQEKRIRRLKAMLKAQEKKLEDVRRKRNVEKTLLSLNSDE